MKQLNVQTNSGACSCGCETGHGGHRSQMKAVKSKHHNHDYLKKGVDCGCGSDQSHQDQGSKEALSYEGCCGERKDNVRSTKGSHDPDDDEDHHHGDSCGCALEIDHGDGCGCSSGSSHEHGDGCGCGGDCVEADFKSKPFIAGIIGFAIGEALDIFQPGIPYAPYVTFAIFLIAYLLVGYKVLSTAGKNILKGKVFDENFLMSIASIGAFCIGQYPEGVAVMLFYQVGEYFQGKAVSKSRKSISELMDIRPDKANLMIDGTLTPVPAETVKVGSLIAVRPGEKVPLDGIVEEGSSDMDTKALTGESIPRDVETGSEVLSGFVNGSGLLTIRVTKEFSQSTVAKILQLVEHASEKKSKTENFITKFARYYTPAVVAIALGLALIPPFLLSMGGFSDWLYRALVFLVVSCPCALVISIPLGFFGGIGAASKNGILIKGSSYLEALNNVDTVIFDKTGTLTDGVFRVKEVYADDDFGRDKVLQYTGAAESHSTHPIAVSIKEACKAGGIEQLPVTENMQERPGFGIKCTIEGKEVLVGSARLLKEEGVKASVDADAAGTVVYLAVDGACKGAVLIADQIKAESVKAVRELTEAGIQTVMLTGDRKEIAGSIGEELGIGRVVSELLPHEKVAALEKIDEEKKRSGKKGAAIFVGDGINDAPVLARADIGIAMGGAGSDAAIEAADAVIMDDNPGSIATALKIAGKTRTIVWQNIALALGVKAVVLILGAFGFATMWEAVFADVGVAILAVLNATRVGGGLK